MRLLLDRDCPVSLKLTTSQSLCSRPEPPCLRYRTLCHLLFMIRLSTHATPQDLRNHGDSPHDARHDYTALAEDVEHFIQEHKIKDSTLIGHSMYATHPSWTYQTY